MRTFDGIQIAPAQHLPFEAEIFCTAGKAIERFSDIGCVEIGRYQGEFVGVQDARVVAPARLMLVELLRKFRRKGAAGLDQLGGVECGTAGRWSCIESTAGNGQIHCQVDVGVNAAGKTAAIEQAKGFLRAGALIGTDAGFIHGLFTLSQVVTGGEQVQHAPVAKAEGEHAMGRDQAVDARPEDVEDMGFVVVGVEILAQRSMSTGHAHIGNADGVGAPIKQRFGIRPRRQQRSQLFKASGKDRLERADSIASNPARGIDVGHRQFDCIRRKRCRKPEYHVV